MIQSEQSFEKINLAVRCRTVWKRLRNYKARAMIQVRNNRGLIYNSDGESREQEKGKVRANVLI